MEVMQGMFEAEGIDLNEVLSMSLVDQVKGVIISFIITTTTTFIIVNVAIVIIVNITIIITKLIRLVWFLVCLSFKILTLLKNKQEKVLQGDSSC